MPRSRALPEVRGKIAVVTGAGSGIGRAIALLLGRWGATVHVTDVDGARADAVAAEIRGAGGAATSRVLDVSDAAAVERFAEEVFAADGGVDLLFNNAGVGHAGAVAETPLEDWRRLVDVNLMGVVHG